MTPPLVHGESITRPQPVGSETVTVLEQCVIFLAGVWAGAINTVVGSGTLVTFPALIGFGVPPVTATMSNAIGLIPGNLAGTWGYRRELQGQGPRLRQQVPASVLGAIVGASLLLHLPSTAFESIVPVLLAVALILVIAQPHLTRRAQLRIASGEASETPSSRRRTVLLLATFFTGTYGGYFSAAQGVLLLGIMGILVAEPLQKVNAAKNVLVLLVNLVAAATYLLFASNDINWTAAGLVAGGSLVGGFVGAKVGRRLSPAALRIVIVVLGCYAIWRILTV
jgi:uncharacterized membrane protein YfcA